MTRIQLSSLVFVTLLVATQAVSNAHDHKLLSQSVQVTKQHGPWMVQVAAFRDTDASKTGYENAAALVKELRLRGIPAYLHSRTIETSEPMREATLSETVVLAGNFRRFNSPNAFKRLFYIRELKAPSIVKLLESRTKMSNASLDKPFMRKNPLVVESN